MRLFIGIFPDERIINELVKIQNQIEDLPETKLIQKEQLHITMKFLGEVDQEKLSEVKSILSTIKFDSFEVSLGKLGFFPSENFIRIVWIDAIPNEKIIELQKKIENSLDPMFQKEGNFYPHITIARVGIVKNKTSFITKVHESKFEKLLFKINEFKLMHSQLTPKGPVYSELATFKAK